VIGITNREFPGVIIDDPKFKLNKQPKYDNKNRGRYLVHIPELMYTLFDTETDGILCVNHVTKWRDTYLGDKNQTAICGAYYPLKTGMHVIVKFFSEDYESGYIDRIVSDYYGDNVSSDVSNIEAPPEKNSMPLKIRPEERDEYYQVLRSDSNDLIAISTLTYQCKCPKCGKLLPPDDDKTCATSKCQDCNVNLVPEIENPVLPPKSIHIYHRNDVIRITMNDDGLFIDVNDKNASGIERDLQIRVNGDARVVVRKDCHVEVGHDARVKVFNDCQLEVGHDARAKIVHDCHTVVGHDAKIKVANDCYTVTGHDADIKVQNNCRMSVGHDAKIKVMNDCHLRTIKNLYMDAKNIYQNFGYSEHFGDADLTNSVGDITTLTDIFVDPLKIPIERNSESETGSLQFSVAVDEI